MSSLSCPVEGCSKDVRRAGFCYSHYMKNWRYGTPTPVHERKHQDLLGKEFGLLTVASRTSGKHWICQCECGETTLALSGDLNRGSKTTCGNKVKHWRSESAGYGAAHDRVRSDRGPASSHSCVDCSEPAKQWSYDHLDSRELLAHGISLHPVAYSLDPNHYNPRCVPCHKRFDIDRNNAFQVT